nr:hypothetical protein [Tanacetum cinerariifolium]
MALAMTEQSRRLHCIVFVEMRFFFLYDSSKSDGQDLFETSVQGRNLNILLEGPLYKLGVPGIKAEMKKNALLVFSGSHKHIKVSS